MKTNVSFKSLLAVTALAAGVAAFAADPAPVAAASSAPADAGHGLLGQTYVNLGYSYTNYTDSNVNANTLGFAFNQGIREGLDTLLEYGYTRTDDTGFGRATQQMLDVGARAFTTFNGVKPYAEAGLGGAWLKLPTVSHERSFVWFVGAGVELPATADLTFTPFARLTYANSLTEHKVWDYGIRANYWVTERVGVVGTLSRDNSRDLSYGIGLNIRY